MNLPLLENDIKNLKALIFTFLFQVSVILWQ